nr:skin secretory protein xP2-like [Solanum lycopersicum]
MPPKKATAAQNGKSSESSATPPLPAELRPAAAPVRGTPPAPEAPTPEPPAPQSGPEDRAMRDAVQLLTRLVADQDVAINWYESWELSRGMGAPPAGIQAPAGRGKGRGGVSSSSGPSNPMPPKKATAAQNGKSVAEGTSQTRRVTRARAQSMHGIMLQSESSATPPPPAELRSAAAPVRGTPPAPEAPTPEPPAPQVFRRQQAVVKDVVEFPVLAVPQTVYML